MLKDFEEFRQGVNLIESGGLDALNGFRLIVEFPQSHDLALPPELRRMFAARLYRNLAEVLESAELYDMNNLSVWWSENNINATYSEPSLAFSVEISSNLRLTIQRSGSSLKVFHAWYQTIMPFAQGLISRAGLDLTEILVSDYDLVPLRAQYIFSIVAFDFQPTHGVDTVTSHEILAPLLGQLPAESGRLSTLSTHPNSSRDSSLARIDIKTSRIRYIAPDMPIREIYNVEAPANQGYRGIWFDFTSVAESLSIDRRRDGTFQPRIAPRIEFLLEHYEMPYVDFFRDRAVAGFMTDLFKNHNFSCTTGAMP